jgi:hypothetical protein
MKSFNTQTFSLYRILESIMQFSNTNIDKSVFWYPTIKDKYSEQGII